MATYAASSPVIRHKNRTGKDNPVSGAMAPLAVTFGAALATNTAYAYQWSPPTGTKYEIVAIDARAITTVDDGDYPSLTVGTAAAGTQIVAAVNLTKTTGTLTLKSTEVTASNVLDVRIANNTTSTATGVSVTIWGYCTQPPDAVFLRGKDHF